MKFKQKVQAKASKSSSSSSLEPIKVSIIISALCYKFLAASFV
jgi:hypothetical protein